MNNLNKNIKKLIYLIDKTDVIPSRDDIRKISVGSIKKAKKN